MNAHETLATHQTLDGAAHHVDFLEVKLLPNLVGAVVLSTLGVHVRDRNDEFLVTNRSSAEWSLEGGVVGGGGELRCLADRLDPPSVLAGLDVVNYLFVRPSNSVAKKIEASFRISLARRRSRFSFSDSFMRLGSSVVRPGQ